MAGLAYFLPKLAVTGIPCGCKPTCAHARARALTTGETVLVPCGDAGTSSDTPGSGAWDRPDPVLRRARRAASAMNAFVMTCQRAARLVPPLVERADPRNRAALPFALV